MAISGEFPTRPMTPQERGRLANPVRMWAGWGAAAMMGAIMSSIGSLHWAIRLGVTVLAAGYATRNHLRERAKHLDARDGVVLVVRTIVEDRPPDRSADDDNRIPVRFAEGCPLRRVLLRPDTVGGLRNGSPVTLDLAPRSLWIVRIDGRDLDLFE